MCTVILPDDLWGYDRKNVGLFGCAGNFKKDEDTLILDGGDILQGSAFAYYCLRWQTHRK